jgi:hypothetical protein
MPAWQCPYCDEPIFEPFDVCWQCGTGKDGKADIMFEPVEDFTPPPEPFPEFVAEKRPFQFSLRSLFVLTTIICIVLGLAFGMPEILVGVVILVIVVNFFGVLAGLTVTHVFRLPDDGSLFKDEPDDKNIE